MSISSYKAKIKRCVKKVNKKIEYYYYYLICSPGCILVDVIGFKKHTGLLKRELYRCGLTPPTTKPLWGQDRLFFEILEPFEDEEEHLPQKIRSIKSIKACMETINIFSTAFLIAILANIISQMGRINGAATVTLLLTGLSFGIYSLLIYIDIKNHSNRNSPIYTVYNVISIFLVLFFTQCMTSNEVCIDSILFQMVLSIILAIPIMPLKLIAYANSAPQKGIKYRGVI